MLKYFIWLQVILQVGEFSTIVCTSSSDTSIVLAIFNLWIAKNGFEVKLDQLGNLSPAIPANHRVGGCRICSRGISSAAPLAKALPGEGLLLISENRLWVKSFFCSQRSSIVTLVETAIYVATVDKLGEVLKSLLDWVKEHKWESLTNCKKYKKKNKELFLENLIFFGEVLVLCFPLFWFFIQGGFVTNPDDERRLHLARCLGRWQGPGVGVNQLEMNDVKQF